MTQSVHQLVRRRDAAQATLDQFVGKPFKWGETDCVRLAAHVARLLGHAPGLSKGGRYSTEAGAWKALKRAGFDTIDQALDAKFFQIPPAAALPGDIIAVEPEKGDPRRFPALQVVVGANRTIGFFQGRCDVLQPLNVLRAWRVEPCPKP